MNTATATDYSRFENMDPANVWETFERDTIQNAYVEWAREQGGADHLLVDFIDYHLCCWAGSEYDIALYHPLRRYCRDELGDASDRAKLVRDAIRAEIDEAVEGLNEAIAMDVEGKIAGYDGQRFRHCNKIRIDRIASLIEEMNDF